MKKKDKCCTPKGQVPRYVDCIGCDKKPIETMSNQSSTFPYVCASCSKEMVAGGFPKWFCLHTTCKNYLKPITK